MKLSPSSAGNRQPSMFRRFPEILVDVAKLRDYCLNDAHPRGRHKARVFKSRLGLTAEDSETLRKAVLTAATDAPSRFQESRSDAYGQRYVLDFPLTNAVGSAVVRTTWIVRTHEDVLILTSCYVL